MSKSCWNRRGRQNVLLALPKQPRAAQKNRQWPTPPQQPPRIPAILGGVRVIVVQQLKHAPRPCRAPRRCCTTIRAVAGQICWHFCGKNSMAAAQCNGPQKLAGSMQPDCCHKSCRFLRHDRAHEFPPEIATIRSLSHMKFGKPRSKSMEKPQGRHSTLPWNFRGIYLGL